jgi:hypothetical protein
MEREVILTISGKYRGNKKLNAEIENIEKMLPYPESFESFCESSEVFDLSRETVITKRRRLREVYHKTVQQNNFLFVFNRN